MTTFIARQPVDLIAIVPYVIGFHPEESAVLLTFDLSPGSGDAVHVRVDLPRTRRQRRAVTAMFRELAARRESTQVGLVLYTEDAGAALVFHDVVVPALVSDGIEVVDVIRVAGGRFHAVDEPDDPGTAFDLDDHPLATNPAVAGQVVFESRAALAESLVGDDSADLEGVALAADRVADSLIEVGREVSRDADGHRAPLAEVLADELRSQARWLQHTLRAHLADPESISVPDAGRILVLVALESLREVAWAETDRAAATAQVELWCSLLRRAPQDLSPGPAGLLAFNAWLNGQGALAWCALDRCFAVDPDDPLAHHVAMLLESATPPTVWAPIPQTSLRVFSDGEA